MSSEFATLRNIAAERERRAGEELRAQREAYDMARRSLDERVSSLAQQRDAIRQRHHSLYAQRRDRELRWYELETASLQLADMTRIEKRLMAEIESLEVDVEAAKEDFDKAREAYLKARSRVEKFDHLIEAVDRDRKRENERKSQAALDEAVTDRALAARRG